MTAGPALEVRRSATLVDVIDTRLGKSVLRVDVAGFGPVTFTVIELDLQDRQRAILALKALQDADVLAPSFRVLRFLNVGPFGGTL